jgi:hypothetical protein
VRVEQVLERLEGVRGKPPQWIAKCPAHEDRTASLTISVGDDGRTLLTCWAGCELDSIAAGIGLRVADLFESKSDQRLSNGNGDRPLWGGRSAADAVVPLEDELARFAERLLDDATMLALAWEHKGWRRSTLAALGIGVVGDRFSVVVRDPAGHVVNHVRYRPDRTPKLLALKGRPRTPLYLLLDDGPVWIVEGEGDAISVAHVGFAAIGAPGASAKAHAEWLDPVRGRDVVVCMDNDEPGRKAAQRWAFSAAGRGASSVRVVTLEGPKGYDVGELVREGRDDLGAVRRLLDELVRDTPLWREPVKVSKVQAPFAADPTETKTGELVLRALSSYRSRAVSWLWRERIPVGDVGILFDPPGLGKSTYTALLASDVSRAGGRVIIASAEDDVEKTLMPRMAVAGAALDQVIVAETKASEGTTTLVLPRDLKSLARMMEGTALLIIDPLSAHLGDDVNAWSEQSMRAEVLAPLAWHSRMTGCTVVLVMHLNKSDRGDALSRISGSGGFGGAARFALLLGTHPDDVALGDNDGRVVLCHVKASLGRKQHTMVFRRETVGFVGDDDSHTVQPTLSLVSDTSTIEPELVLLSTDPEERSSYVDALEWLRRELSVGPQLAKPLLAQARERGDFSERTLRKAKRALGVVSEREPEGWFWRYDPTRER